MRDRHGPEMSVIIVTPDRYQTIRETMRHLRAQTVRGRLEVVIVAPSAQALDLDEAELADFLQFRVVVVGRTRSAAEARAAGVRQAGAPVVALAEDHAFPGPGWAEALIEAHRQPWAAVGPVMANANPDSVMSWADFLVAYAPWAEPTPPGVVGDLPGHNSSYKRAILLEYGPRLGRMLGADTLLHWDMRAKGHRLYAEPAARTTHLNFELLSPWLMALFHSGRVFAGTRAWAGRWSPVRRLLLACGAPLIPSTSPLWRLRGLSRELGRPGRPRGLLPRILPAVMLGLTVSGAGQMVGYLFGVGGANQRLYDLEFRRRRYARARAGQSRAIPARR